MEIFNTCKTDTYRSRCTRVKSGGQEFVFKILYSGIHFLLKSIQKVQRNVDLNWWNVSEHFDAYIGPGGGCPTGHLCYTSIVGLLYTCKYIISWKLSFYGVHRRTIVVL